ncbi:MAG TPA: hypothetical protein VGB37_08280, partial [Candidatus Lokiarchaeia archaeon]
MRKANQMQKEGISVVVVYDIKDQNYSVFKKSHYDYLTQSNEINPKDWKVIKEFEVEGSESQDVTINKVKASDEEQPLEVDLNEPEERFVKKSVEVDLNEPEETEEEIPEEKGSEEDITPEEFEPEEEEEGSDEELNKRKTFKLGKGPEPLNRVESKQVNENINDKLSGYEDVICPYCGSEETVFMQYVDGGSWKCQNCGKWIKDKDIKESKQIKENFSRE